MDIKERIESVLSSAITDEQLKQIESDYLGFYRDPEGFRKDGIVDIICDDLGLPHQPTKLIDVCNRVAGMDMKHTDPGNTLAWGTYKDHPIYAMYADKSWMRFIQGYGSEMGNWEKFHDDELVAEVAVADDESHAIVFVLSCKTIHAIGELPFTICNIPGYKRGCMRRLFDNKMMSDWATFYVPFVPSGTGRNPVMWIDHRDWDPRRFPTTLDELAEREQDLTVGVDEDNLKTVYTKLKNAYPGVDLNVEPENRYVSLACNGQVVIYNRNHLAYNGNIPAAQALMPWIVEQLIGKYHEANIFDIMSAVDGAAWSSIFYKVAPHPGEAVAWDANGVIDKKDSSVTAGYVGKERGEGSAKSTLGKLFQNASSDYKQIFDLSDTPRK